MLRTQITTWQENETALRQIRTEVFLEEQSVPEALEWDADDAEAVHFLVWTEDQQAIATARLIRDRAREARIGRFAVLKPFRHSGIGGRLLGYVLGYARSQGIEQLTLSAQVSFMSRPVLWQKGMSMMKLAFRISKCGCRLASLNITYR